MAAISAQYEGVTAMAKRFVLILSILGFLAACETVKGVGRDIENAGEALDKAVD